MGLFDFFKGKSDKTAVDEKSLSRHAERIMDKRALSPDRFASIDFLCKVGTPEGWRAVLPRFNFNVDPSITDREEKQYIFDAAVLDPEHAIDPVCEFLKTAETLHWPIKVLRKITTSERIVSELLAILDGFDTGYGRNADRKAQVIAELENDNDPRIAESALPFLRDFSEDVRFHAVRTIMAQDAESEASAALSKLLIEDESTRIRTTVLEGYLQNGWKVSHPDRAALERVLLTVATANWRLTDDGKVTRR
ncbi:MAG: hypothetical protein Q8Q09_29260 [Deltaproteobacteria bacterium]|nr:hypothetical protein [Deltaproteobacteria bacterium]